MNNCDKYNTFHKNVYNLASLPKKYRDAVRLYTGDYYKGEQIPGNVRFLEYMIPTSVLVRDLEELARKEGYSDFSAYHNVYASTHDLKKLDEIWPIFLDDNFGCIIEDGISRFHSYVEQKLEFIPCIVMREVNYGKC